jgi:CHAT domain-containing protein
LGSIISIAPNYPSGWDVEPLPAARAESDAIMKMFGAVQVPGIYPEVIGVFEDLRNENIGILHFAGHGSNLSDPQNAAILLEEKSNVTALEVRSPTTILGKKRRSLAFFNVCRAGAIGETLGTVGGLAEALINKEFTGFIAPMWAVYDQNAATVSTKFLYSIRNERQTVAEALRQIREEFGTYSPTYLSYIFYGDVMARLS